jgi:hypothetical protein
MLESFDPFHCTLSLVNPINDIPLRRGRLVRYLAEVDVSARRLDSG